MQIDISKIESLLAEKKFDEAKALIKAAFASKLDDKERGEIITNVAQVYLKISNSINEEYSKVLDQAIASMQAVNNFGSKVEDSIKVEELVQSLPQA